MVKQNPTGKYAIGTKWILKNKRDARGIVVRNKARHVAQGHRQEEGIDYDEVFALVARIEVQQRPDGIFIYQEKYLQYILYKFNLGNVRTATTPYEATKPKSKSESDSPINVHLYRSMIGSLMYLTASRPDMMFAVSACLRHQITPTTSNLEVVKKIFKYLKVQPKLGLWYPKESPLVLEAYSDSDYAGANNDRKSITGGCQFLGRRLISWQCKKQTIVASSSTEAGYVAAANWCDQYQPSLKIIHKHKHSTILQQSSMAALKYKEEHNKVGYLLKPTGSDDYHQIIDFLSESHIRYALTTNPIIFDSLVKQFWLTATLRAPELVPPAILATIDNTPYTITEELGMVNNVGNDKKFLMYLRFLQTILGIETRVNKQYKVLVFSSKLFANIRLNFAGNPIPLLTTMLLQAAAGGGAEVAAQDVSYPVPAPDQSTRQLTTPSRPHSPDSVAPILKHDHSSTQPETAAGSFPSTKDAYMGADFHTSPVWSSHTPPVDHPSGGVEDPITLMILSSVVSTLVQKVHSMEAELHDHKKLFKNVVGKLVKKVKSLEVKLKTKKRKMVVSDSDEEDGTTPNVNLEALHALANAANVMGKLVKKVKPNASLSKTLLGDDMAEDNFPACMVALIKKKRQALAKQLFKERQNRPLTPAQQKAYMRQYVKNQSSAIYSTRWSMAYVKSFSDEQLLQELKKFHKVHTQSQLQSFSRTFKRPRSVLEEPPTKMPKSPKEPTPSMPEIPIPPAVASPPSSRTRKKSIARKHVHKPKPKIPTLDLDAPAQEILSTPLGDINALYHIDGTTKHFTTLCQILHLVDRQDLMRLYGLVVQYYEQHPAVGSSLLFWGDLQVLFDSQAGGKGSSVWQNQHLWEIQSWRLYTLSNVHILETMSGEVLLMFTDVTYPLSVELMKKMLMQKLEIDSEFVGNDLTTAEQLIQFIKNQIVAAQASSV
nr:ribonuclease H-like domain, reverse transcriptase, RNA-dependent DNA polymerase [Tanacetum cinerariifolium]